MELKDYNLYSLFLKAVELKNYTRVAEAVGLSSHKIVSEKMVMLEEKLGVKLFVRAFRSMEPTSDALVLYEKVKHHLTGLDLAADNLREFDENSEAVIRIGIPVPFANLLFRDFFKSFNNKYPYVKFEFLERDNFELLKDGKIDLVIHSDYSFDGYKFESINLFNLKCIFIGSKDFIKKSQIKGTLTIQDLEKLPLIGHRVSLKKLKQSNNVNFSVLIEGNSEIVLPYIKANMGLGLYYEILLNAQNDNDVSVVVAENIVLPVSQIACSYNKEFTNNAALTLIRELNDFCTISPLFRTQQ